MSNTKTKAPEWHEDIDTSNIGGLEILDVADRFALIKIGPSWGHREDDSLALVAYADEGSREAALADFGAKGPKAFKKATKTALCMVADPDLSLGDWGIDVKGDESALPGEFAAWARQVADKAPAVSAGMVVATTIAGTFEKAAKVARGEAKMPVDPYEAEDYVPDDVRAVRGRPRHASLIALVHLNDGFLGLVERSNMKWEKAALSVYDQGLCGAVEGGDSAARLRQTVLLPVSADAPGKHPVATARKAARGTGRTTDRQRYVHHLMTSEMGLPPSELPALAVDAKKVIEQIQERRTAMIESGAIGATPAQVAYAQAISERLGIEAPPEGSTRKAVGDFISANKDAFDHASRTIPTSPEETT